MPSPLYRRSRRSQAVVCSSTTGGPFPAWLGSFGSTCTAHAHTRARAHARARPRCTLQNTFPQHCTSTTTAHFCTCTLTCTPRSGAGGRCGLCRAWRRVSQPPIRRRASLRGLQPPQHEAAGRFAAALQFGGMGRTELRPSDRAACNGFVVLQWPRVPAHGPRVTASAAHERVASKAFVCACWLRLLGVVRAFVVRTRPHARVATLPPCTRHAL